MLFAIDIIRLPRRSRTLSTVVGLLIDLICSINEFPENQSQLIGPFCREGGRQINYVSERGEVWGGGLSINVTALITMPLPN